MPHSSALNHARETAAWRSIEPALRLVADRNGPPNGLPNACYRDGEIAELERQFLFGRNWSCIGFASDAPGPGDIFPVDFLGQPLLMVRGRDEKLRVFHNVCRHRGMILAEKPGRCRGLLTCRYHSWSYDLEGNLKRTPQIGGEDQDEIAGFDPTLHGLIEVRSTVWMDLVLVDLSGEAPGFEDVHGDLLERWAAFQDAPLVHCGADSVLEFSLECNWKLAIENFCEAYHLPWVHPGLNSYSRLSDHENIVAWGRYSGQLSHVYAPQLSPEGRRFPVYNKAGEKWRRRAEYIVLYPNVMLGLHEDSYYALIVQPRGATHTHERFNLYYFDEAVHDDVYGEMRSTNLANWRTIMQEDVFAVEGMQRGRDSDAFDGGVFTPLQDQPTRCFNQWVASRMLAGAAPPDETRILAAE